MTWSIIALKYFKSIPKHFQDQLQTPKPSFGYKPNHFFAKFWLHDRPIDRMMNAEKHIKVVKTKKWLLISQTLFGIGSGLFQHNSAL